MIDKKVFLSLLLSKFFIIGIYAQISQGGEPYSFKFKIEDSKNIPEIEIPRPDLELLFMEDLEMEATKGAIRKGKIIDVDITPETHGKWQKLQDGGWLWKAAFYSKGALGLDFYFDKFYLPSGATLFFYSADKKQVIGAFTEVNNNEDGIFATEVVIGEKVVMELYLPENERNNYTLHLNGIGYMYKNFSINYSKATSDTCQVNVNCPEGADWQNQKRGVVKIKIKKGSNWYECSGSLINNTAKDCTPYVLTADHCGGDATANDLKSWIFYFNYEAKTCTGVASLTTRTMQGCSLVARDYYSSSGTTKAADFYLVKLNSNVPSTHQAYYNGWSRVEEPSPNGVCIHHPQGDLKKISTYKDPPSVMFQNFWLVKWAATETNHGVTEQGSSGSPLFSYDKLIIGVLSGGSSSCEKPDLRDSYGRFVKFWDQLSTEPQKQLRPWLDPIGTNPIKLEGLNFDACPFHTNVMENNSKIHLSIYPNPATNIINVELENANYKQAAIEIYTSLGKKIYEQHLNDGEKTIPINVSNFANGIYILILKSNSTITSSYFSIMKSY